MYRQPAASRPFATDMFAPSLMSPVSCAHDLADRAVAVTEALRGGRDGAGPGRGSSWPGKPQPGAGRPILNARLEQLAWQPCSPAAELVRATAPVRCDVRIAGLAGSMTPLPHASVVVVVDVDVVVTIRIGRGAAVLVVVVGTQLAVGHGSQVTFTLSVSLTFFAVPFAEAVSFFGFDAFLPSSAASERASG
jgi:hypothetical protein